MSAAELLAARKDQLLADLHKLERQVREAGGAAGRGVADGERKKKRRPSLLFFLRARAHGGTTHAREARTLESITRVCVLRGGRG